MARNDIATVETSVGEVQAVFAFDNWVMVEGPGRRSVQRRCERPTELRPLLSQLGVPDHEAADVASALWTLRPKDAAGTDVRINESKARSTGLPPLRLALVLLIFIAVVVYVILHGFAAVPFGF